MCVLFSNDWLNSLRFLTPCFCPPPRSCDQALLWLPAASEAPHASHLPAPAAGHHVGRTQTQDLQFLAQHRTLDTVQKMRDSVHSRLCLNLCFYPSVTCLFLLSNCESTLWVCYNHSITPRRCRTSREGIPAMLITSKKDGYYCSTAPLPD